MYYVWQKQLQFIAVTNGDLGFNCQIEGLKGLNLISLDVDNQFK